MSKSVVILAGGVGTRLLPYTTVFPKPLVPLGEHPILEIIIRQLAGHGYQHVIMAVNHKAALIQAFFGDGSRWNLNIEYSIEDRPLGTMGPLKLIDNLPDHFLVMNGDLLTDIDYRSFQEFHLKNESLLTIANFQRELRSEFGELEIKDNCLLGFQEKPITKTRVSMGINMLNRKVLEYIPEGIPFGFDQLVLKLMALKERITTYSHQGIWLDIGRAQDYAEAISVFDKMKGKLFV